MATGNPIRHVILLILENGLLDQILGDLYVVNNESGLSCIPIGLGVTRSFRYGTPRGARMISYKDSRDLAGGHAILGHGNRRGDRGGGGVAYADAKRQGPSINQPGLFVRDRMFQGFNEKFDLLHALHDARERNDKALRKKCLRY